MNTYEAPTVSPYEDIRPYVGLLLGVIDDVLRQPYSWLPEDRDSAISFMGALQDWLMGMPTLLMQTGMMIDFGGTTNPDGWLTCDGTAISRSTYADLFNVIGTSYGAGNGTTTFNLPDFRGKTSIGDGTGTGLTARSIGDSVGTETQTLTVNNLASHVHTIAHTHNILAKNNSAAGISNRLMRGSTLSGADQNVTTDAIVPTPDSGSAGSGTAHNNMQPSLVARKIIKV